MAGEKDLLAGFFDAFARDVVAAGHGDHVHEVAAPEHLLGQRDGNDDRTLDVAERHGGTLLADDADDGEIAVVDLDDPARGVFAAGKEVFPHLGADDADLALALHVDVVDEASVEDLLRVDALVVGRITHQRVVALAVAAAAMEFAAPERGRGVEHFGQLFEDFDVAVDHAPPAVFGHAFVRYGGLLGLHEDGVGRHVAQLGPEQALQTHAGAEHDGKHEDAPEDAERRHDAAFAVARNGLPYLAPAVAVEKSGH